MIFRDRINLQHQEISIEKVFSQKIHRNGLS